MKSGYQLLGKGAVRIFLTSAAQIEKVIAPDSSLVDPSKTVIIVEKENVNSPERVLGR